MAETILTLAAKGDRDALALIRDGIADETTTDGTPFRQEDMWAQAEVMARLTAEHGVPADLVTLGMILLVRSRMVQATHGELAGLYEQEATACFNAVIDSGDAEAIAMLTAHVELQADNGDPSAIPYLTAIIEKLPRETAAKVSEAARNKKVEMAK